MTGRAVTDRPSEEILAKVRKLLALGESPSEAEAASALAKARSLLARHGLSLEDVKPERDDIVESAILEKRRLRAWESHLVAVVTEATFTRALHVTAAGSSRVLIVGREVNTGAAKALFEYLHLVVLKLGPRERRAGSRIWKVLSSGSSTESVSGSPRARKGSRAQTVPGRQTTGPKAGMRTHAIARPERMPKQTPSTTLRTGNLPSRWRARRRARTTHILRKNTERRKRSGRDGASNPIPFYRGRAAGDTVSLARQLANR